MDLDTQSDSLRERPRRLRKHPMVRRLVRETVLSRDDLILPLFVVPGKNVRDEVVSMPGVFRESIDSVAESCKKAADLGINGVILFGIPESKDATGSTSWTGEHSSRRTTKRPSPWRS